MTSSWSDRNLSHESKLIGLFSELDVGLLGLLSLTLEKKVDELQRKSFLIILLLVLTFELSLKDALDVLVLVTAFTLWFGSSMVDLSVVRQETWSFWSVGA